MTKIDNVINDIKNKINEPGFITFFISIDTKVYCHIEFLFRDHSESRLCLNIKDKDINILIDEFNLCKGCYYNPRLMASKEDVYLPIDIPVNPNNYNFINSDRVNNENEFIVSFSGATVFTSKIDDLLKVNYDFNKKFTELIEFYRKVDNGKVNSIKAKSQIKENIKKIMKFLSDENKLIYELLVE